MTPKNYRLVAHHRGTKRSRRILSNRAAGLFFMFPLCVLAVVGQRAKLGHHRPHGGSRRTR